MTRGKGGRTLHLSALPDCAQRWGRAQHTLWPREAPTGRHRGGRRAGRGGGGKQTGACIPTPLHAPICKQRHMQTGEGADSRWKRRARGGMKGRARRGEHEEGGAKKREGGHTTETETARQGGFREGSRHRHECGTWATMEGAREGARAQDTAQRGRVRATGCAQGGGTQRGG